MDIVDERDFDRGVLARPGRVAALFYADWCPYARRFRPVFEAADLRMAKVLVDISDEGPVWERCRIPVVPTVIVYADGHEVARLDGRPSRGLAPADLERLVPPGC